MSNTPSPIRAFLNFIENERKAGATVSAYATDLSQLTVYLAMRNVTLAGAHPAHLLAFLETFSKSATRARKTATLRSFYSFLLGRGIILENPMAGIERPAVESPLPALLSVEEVERLIDAPGLTTRDRAMIALLYAGGLRASEVVALDVSDLDQAEMLHVGGARFVPLSASTMAIVKAYMLERAYQNRRGSASLFLSYAGERLTRQAAWIVVRRAAKRAGLGDIGPSTLRHSFAAHLLEQGHALTVVQELLGHNDIGHTQKYRQALNASLISRNTRLPAA